MSEEEIAAELAPGPDDPQPLAAEEQEERQALLAEGFATWNRRDFMVRCLVGGGWGFHLCTRTWFRFVC